MRAVWDIKRLVCFSPLIPTLTGVSPNFSDGLAVRIFPAPSGESQSKHCIILLQSPTRKDLLTVAPRCPAGPG